MIRQLNEFYNYPTDILANHFDDLRAITLTTGYLEFHSITEVLKDYDRIKGWTIGGSVLTTFEDTLVTGDIVNPFPTLLLDQIGFQDVLIQSQNTFYPSEFSPDVYLTTAMSRSHLPKPIYQHLEDSFFQQLCPFDVESFRDEDTDEIVHSFDCTCEGNDYGGMPNIDFLLYIDEYSTGSAY